ncbi:radical SAM protein [Propionivibrio sp.]|uniref:radical SAM protein n=1 Tax=Propionivibrio sp. TaxID=2212460 RepID=UPI0025D53546|nr:radical SAM protein [Propionivibrio sp.]MBK7356276.1 radical SAM protein [Propionivibrio sp.]MBK8746183.1 radical SAM protein [Propionivibrio sp.]MBK8894506.1 radical SAM protein [Propionivibrio sp.]MBL0208341.1 radical SAM protein [Propionivibrio sp.]
MLNINNHSRDSAGMTYVYPVLSRRAGGVSVGINLNVNNACNWACVYCQVPDLSRGGPPPVDLDLLEAELGRFLKATTMEDELLRIAPPDSRRLADVAFSGNGEPTSAPEFAEAVDRVGRLLREFGLLEGVKIRLITNGSLMHRLAVQQGIARIGALNGEVWFKLDRATEGEIERINGIRIAPQKIRESLLLCSTLAPTWIQTCCFAIDGQEINEAERSAYLALIESLKDKIKGVHLYGLARPSMQPDAGRLSNLPPEHFRHLAESISALGIEVVANP